MFKRTLDTVQGGTKVKDFRAVRGAENVAGMGDRRNTFFGGDSVFKRTLDTVQGGTKVKDFRAVNVGEGNSCAWHNCSLFPVILSLNK